MEKDNRGTRHDTEDIASSYWMTRISQTKKDPFVLYSFDTEKQAKDALLELPCIHEAEDTGKLICTEVLIFGCYKTQKGTCESVICGGDLTHDLWDKARKSFIKHGGKPRGQGDLEPEKGAKKPAPKVKSKKSGQVVFVREDKQNRMGVNFTYKIHKGPNAAAAKEFLANQPVNKQFLYYVVETPEGNYCKDIQGMYKE